MIYIAVVREPNIGSLTWWRQRRGSTYKSIRISFIICLVARFMLKFLAFEDYSCSDFDFQLLQSTKISNGSPE